MKVALITDGVMPYVVGGIQRHSQMMVQSLTSLGVEVHLFHTCKEEGRKAKAKKMQGFTPGQRNFLYHYFVDYPEEKKSPGHYPGELKEYSRRVYRRYQEDELDVDFIYAQGLTGWAFAHANREDMPPLGVNIHGCEMFQPAANWRAKLEHWMLRTHFSALVQKADVVFSFSGKVRKIHQEKMGVPGHKVAEIANGIDAEWLADQYRPTKPLREFLFVGRFERRKGVEEIYRAISSLKESDFKFHFVGAIPESLRLNDPKVFYHGAIREDLLLRELFDRCDVLVCPSYSEGMPTVILEAMARGLAVIATNVGAVEELVSQENGILLSDCRPEKIAGAMQALLTASDLTLDALKSCSLQRVQNYTWENISRQTVKAIEQSCQ